MVPTTFWQRGSWHAGGLLLLGALLAPAPAGAIPAFARAHGVACTSCHVVITRRSEFGDAFRRGGFHWPGAETDAASRRPNPPTEMTGLALLTAQLPFHLPLSVVGSASASLALHDRPTDAAHVGLPSLKLLLGGSLGRHVSFFGNWSGLGAPEELYVHFARILAGSPVLNIRLGRLEPTTTLFRTNEALLSPFLISSSTLTGHTVGGGRLGLEANGVVLERGFWAAGVVADQDRPELPGTYVHTALKLGGMDFLGQEPLLDLDANPAVALLDDLLLTVGGWMYAGLARVSGAPSRVLRLGVDAKFRFRQFSAWSGAMLGRDRDGSVGADNTSFTAFVELSAALTPWLVPVYSFQFQDAASLRRSTQRHDLGVLLVVLENFRVRLATQFTNDLIKNETVDAQILFGF